jgi:hypothetical protein
LLNIRCTLRTGHRDGDLREFPCSATTRLDHGSFMAPAQYCDTGISKHEGAFSCPWRRCQCSRYLWVSLRVATCPRLESFAFIMFRNPCAAAPARMT